MTSTLLSPMVDYYNDEEDLDSVDDDDDRSFRGRGSEEGNVLNQTDQGVGSVYFLEKGRKRVFVWTKLNTFYSLRGAAMFLLFGRIILIWRGL